MIGTKQMLIKNIHMMLIDAITPNSFMISECVNTNVPKPIAVVALVKKVAFPTFCITLSNALILLP